ncbi:hypothetical protein ACIP2Y_41300 [Streptomyces sviceus]|uniref:hypothetical protein n=1 Tax=Streptomyces sviceus TaxID=285530 RepID=UPI00380C622C
MTGYGCDGHPRQPADGGLADGRRQPQLTGALLRRLSVGVPSDRDAFRRTAREPEGSRADISWWRQLTDSAPVNVLTASDAPKQHHEPQGPATLRPLHRRRPHPACTTGERVPISGW